MAAPTNDGTSYFGNALCTRTGSRFDEGRWVCVEVHAKLNPDPATGASAVLEVFKNDANVMRFDDSADWLLDPRQVLPDGGRRHRVHRLPCAANEKLDLRFRSTTALASTRSGRRNYITDPAQGTLTLDQMVVATQRIGCIR